MLTKEARQYLLATLPIVKQAASPLKGPTADYEAGSDAPPTASAGGIGGGDIMNTLKNPLVMTALMGGGGGALLGLLRSYMGEGRSKTKNILGGAGIGAGLGAAGAAGYGQIPPEVLAAISAMPGQVGSAVGSAAGKVKDTAKALPGQAKDVYAQIAQALGLAAAPTGDGAENLGAGQKGVTKAQPDVSVGPY
jgi:hypothetical protein